jgi:hypothetical protein
LDLIIILSKMSKHVQRLVGRSEGKKNNLRDLGVDGRIILRWVCRKWDVGGMEWIELAQDRDR